MLQPVVEEGKEDTKILTNTPNYLGFRAFMTKMKVTMDPTSQTLIQPVT